MDGTRLAACATVGATGCALLVPTGGHLVGGGTASLGLLLGCIGAAVSLAVAAAGLVLYVSDVSTTNAVRVAAWNALGLVVLGTVLLLGDRYTGGAIPPLLVGDILAVSAFAHVLIGFNDVRRIRATEIAEKSEKLAVLSRLLRHNLRTEAQVLIGRADLLSESVSDGTAREHAEIVASRARKLGRMNDSVKHVFWALDGEWTGAESVRISAIVDGVVADAEETHPEARIDVDVDREVSVVGGDRLGAALDHVVENAIEHNAADVPEVRVETDADGGSDWVELAVGDNGPGIPEVDRSVVEGDAEITQLTHGGGLGLWVTQWIVDAYGGAVDFAASDEGSVVTFRLRRAA